LGICADGKEKEKLLDKRGEKRPPIFCEVSKKKILSLEINTIETQTHSTVEKKIVKNHTEIAHEEMDGENYQKPHLRNKETLVYDW
jgi:hypothetical protein